MYIIQLCVSGLGCYKTSYMHIIQLCVVQF